MRNTELFIQALENSDKELLKKIPKTDLHNHSTSGCSREYIKKYSSINIPKLGEKLKSMDEMHQWMSKNIDSYFETAEGRNLLLEGCFQVAKDDGVVVLEVGEDVWGNGNYYNGDISKLIAHYKGAHKKICPQVDFRFQVGLSRHCPIKLLEEWMEPFLMQDCFYSIDLYCDEFAQPIKNFKPLYKKAKEKGWLLKAHVGEWGTADDVKEAVEELELNEVQHGIAAANSPHVMNWLRDNKIQLNITPTSNVLLSRVESIEKHPIRKLYDYGVRVTINSDDIIIFDSEVSKEYMRLYEVKVFTASELNQIRLYGLESRGHHE
ncbi:adenosine deaminase [Clostridium amylolyticum]|uniref:Adenosine deaminase n=1 Tax=Clostridium amylolyticum TaxID=1121298 RepID=A0A1M6ECX7_9CLOT|nr:adenosine deaminase [Clostridium amylolyticum]SHI83170.1 adenosine deaminase [Clostridium amylolyticum]